MHLENIGKNTKCQIAFSKLEKLSTKFLEKSLKSAFIILQERKPSSLKIPLISQFSSDENQITETSPSKLNIFVPKINTPLKSQTSSISNSQNSSKNISNILKSLPNRPQSSLSNPDSSSVNINKKIANRPQFGVASNISTPTSKSTRPASIKIGSGKTSLASTQSSSKVSTPNHILKTGKNK